MILLSWQAAEPVSCLIIAIGSHRKPPGTKLRVKERTIMKIEKVLQDASAALKAEFEEGYSAGYADAWQEIKKIVSNAAFDAEMGAAYGEVV